MWSTTYFAILNFYCILKLIKIYFEENERYFIGSKTDGQQSEFGQITDARV